MVELITGEKMRGYDYLRIRCEFYDIGNKLFLNKDQIDRVVFRSFGRFWPLGRLVSQSRLRKLWLLPRIEGGIIRSELILRSNQLWMPRAWEYPWALLNSDVVPGKRVPDVRCGWSLFPSYLARKGGDVSSMDMT